MKKEVFTYRTRIEAPLELVFRWHTRSGALERLMPPWERWEILERPSCIKDGTRAVIKLKIGPFSRRWVVEHRDYREGIGFKDVQVSGPFKLWEHSHLFEPDGPSGCFIEDRIEYVLPFGWIGSIVGSSFVRNKLKVVFSYRHRVIKEDIEMYKRYGEGNMKILVTGAGGLIGSALTAFLKAGGHEVTRLRHSKRTGEVPSDRNEIFWNIEAKRIDLNGIEGHDVVVHLAGENIAGIWTGEKKRRIRESRVEGTRFLCESLSKLGEPPQVLVCASAIGYYGDRGDEVLTEEKPKGRGFLADVCSEWESAVEPAVKRGIRVVNLRFGIVLSPKGGALGMMLLPFRLGLGGRIGSGEQYWSWVALDDAIGAIYHTIKKTELEGPVNVVSPNPVTNREFVKTLGRVLGRPAFIPLPESLVRLVAGEMGEEMLLASVRVMPKRLLDSGYEFHYPDLEVALRHLLGRM
ncbi:MAG: hypothetical protein KatS3mg078_1209 [Deltaproteobacteria bacterium]|jgi:uncharacterized protein (TIGR01777 family)|nr:MAG: hypothetical protein KatS3mg078_1209 [Deltaproteobacteria bacterium]